MTPITLTPAQEARAIKTIARGKGYEPETILAEVLDAINEEPKKTLVEEVAKAMCLKTSHGSGDWVDGCKHDCNLKPLAQAAIEALAVNQNEATTGETK